MFAHVAFYRPGPRDGTGKRPGGGEPPRRQGSSAASSVLTTADYCSGGMVGAWDVSGIG
jgi:hypothetical protein